MAEDKFLLTEEGYKKLKKELDYLESSRKWELAKELKEASKHGDLRENSEFLYTKDELNLVKVRISELKELIKKAEIVDTTDVNTEKVSIGNIVKVKDLEIEECINYEIVGNTESNPAKMKIAIDTPIGKALLNRKAGEIIKIKIPAGTLTYKILSIYK